MKFSIVLTAAHLLLVSAAIRAEPVLIQNSEGDGQGWIFKQGDQCLVATARHVISNGRGTIVTQDGDLGQISSVRLSDNPDLDIGVAVIEGQAKRNCPAETLGYPDSRPALQDASLYNRELVLQVVPPCSAQPSSTTRCGGATNTPVKIDTYGGRDIKFGFYPKGLIRTMSGGDSGSIIRDSGGNGVAVGQPLGMVTDASTKPETPSIGIIFSEVRKFVQTQLSLAVSTQTGELAGRSSGIAGLTLIDYRGQLGSPDCGPLNMLQPGPCPFVASPLPGKRTVDVVVKPNSETSISGITFNFPQGAPLPKGIEILVSMIDYTNMESATWTSVRYCSPNAVHFTCNVAIGSVKNLAIRFNGSVSVSAVGVQGANR